MPPEVFASRISSLVSCAKLAGRDAGRLLWHVKGVVRSIECSCASMQVYSALDALGQVGWRINAPMHAAVEAAWAAGGGVCELPSAADLPALPPPGAPRFRTVSTRRGQLLVTARPPPAMYWLACTLLLCSVLLLLHSTLSVGKQRLARPARMLQGKGAGCWDEAAALAPAGAEVTPSVWEPDCGFVMAEHGRGDAHRGVLAAAGQRAREEEEPRAALAALRHQPEAGGALLALLGPTLPYLTTFGSHDEVRQHSELLHGGVPTPPCCFWTFGRTS